MAELDNTRETRLYYVLYCIFIIHCIIQAVLLRTLTVRIVRSNCNTVSAPPARTCAAAGQVGGGAWVPGYFGVLTPEWYLWILGTLGTEVCGYCSMQVLAQR